MLKFWSSISQFVQIAIVVGAVLVFAFFDPFGFLTPRKQTLEDTPVSVRSIKEIGKLISAEYYGEVLTSLQESLIDEISTEIENDLTEITSVQDQFDQAILDLSERKVSFKKNRFNEGKKLYDFFYQEYQSLAQHPYYQTFIEIVLDKDYENNTRSGKIRRGEKKLLKELYNTPESELEAKLDSLKIDPAIFEAERKKRENLLTADKKFRKKQIVVLGRGWVKAGINFEKFTERNFRYDKERKTIHLVGLKPEILIYTINPWFIPEKKVKGFEVILITRKANDPKYMKAVKQQSLEKLRQKAIQAGILEQAKTNAEENLKNLFSLLLPEGINQVIIHDSFLSYFDESFKTDSLTYSTMQSIDSLLIKQYKSDSSAVTGLRDSLNQRKLLFHGKYYPVDRYSSQLYFAEDETLSEREKKWLKNEKQIIEKSLISLNDTLNNLDTSPPPIDRLDSIWFYPNSSVIEKYQEEANDTYTQQFGFFDVISEHTNYIALLKKKKAFLTRKVYLYMLKRKLSAYHEFTGILKDNLLQVVLDNTTYVLNADTENLTENSSGQSIEYLESLEEQLIDIDAGIHDWIRNPREFVTLGQLIVINQLMKEDWVNKQSSVVELRNLAINKWGLRVEDDSLQINGYSSWYSFVENDTLDNNEILEIYKNYQSIKSDSLLLTEKVTDLDEKWEKNLLISELDKAWYYPSKDSVQVYQSEAKKRDFGTWKVQKKKRKMLRKSFIDQKIYRSIQASRKRDIDKIVNTLLKSVEVVDNKGFKFDVTETGFSPTLPDSLLFLENLLLRQEKER